MKKQQRNELHMMDKRSLEVLIGEERQKLLLLRMQRAAGTLKNTSQIREARKMIARAFTLLTHRT